MVDYPVSSSINSELVLHHSLPGRIPNCLSKSQQLRHIIVALGLCRGFAPPDPEMISSEYIEQLYRSLELESQLLVVL